MSTAPPSISFLTLQRKLLVTGVIEFQTAWRIGSGREGEISDLGVLLTPDGRPVLPGSSLKGVLRSTCERLAHALDLSACQLDMAATGVTCATDVKGFRESSGLKKGAEQAAALPPKERMAWIDEHTCDVCRLFGSPLRRSVLKIGDGELQSTDDTLQVRDSVVIDRDSRTARDKRKFDFDVINHGSRFAIRIDLENPSPADEALLGAALFEWTAGTAFGGFTSRGLGRAVLTDVKVAGVDFSEPAQRRKYLTTPDADAKLTDAGDWQTYFQAAIEDCLATTQEGD